MPYTFDAIYAVDPNNTANVAKNATITIFDPADATQAPITITDPTGVPLPNPITVDAAGMGPAFQHPTLARVGWKGAGFTNYFTSYEGMFNETTAAKAAAETAASEAVAAAADRVATATVNASGKLILTKATGATVDAGSVIGPQGPQGAPGQNGSNVLPTDTAIKNAITTPGTETSAALKSTFASSGLSRWQRKLESRAAEAKLVFMGDSTSEEGNVAKAIRERLQLIHIQSTEGLAGMAAANIKLLGWGGNTQAGWWDAHGAAVIAENPDLLVYSLGINSVRTGLVSQEQLTAGITSDVNAIRAALPNTDIILRIPNPLTTTDTSGWVTPNSAAQTYTDILRNTYLSLDGLWPNVVVWNAQDQVFGRASKPTADYGGLMGDQLHPSTTGYHAIADSLVAELIGRPRRFVATPRNIDMHAASRPAHPYVVGDKVDRADAATAGTASSGQAYTADIGTFGIVSGRIKKTDTGGTSVTSVDAGIADGEFGITFTTVDLASTQALVFRKIAGNNWLYFRRMTNQWHLGQLVNGTATNLATDTTTPCANGDRVAVVCQGSLIKAYVNDNLILSATTTQFQTATRIGIQANSQLSAYADLYAKKLV